MGKRSKDDGIESMFGSDSFLDVVANIVGILIIMIVLVGIQIRHADPSLQADADAERLKAEEIRGNWEKERDQIEAENRAAEESHRRQADELAQIEKAHRDQLASRAAEQAALDKKRQEHEAERSQRERILREYEDEASRMQAELADLAERLDLVRTEEAQAQKQQEKERKLLQDKIAENEKFAQEMESTLARERRELVVAQGAGEDLQKKVLELRRLIEEVKREAPAVKPVRHYATPMARRVSQHELHFRCKNGRLSYTYLEELASIAKDQAQGRITASTSRIDGVAGPMGGFRLKYTFARPGDTLSEQLGGANFVRYALVYWELVADSDFIGETKEEAVEPNSALRVKLRSTPATTHSITLWVSPDSFEIAKAVEEILQESSYTVSLRPLPAGVPIVGSPFGTATDSH